MPTGSLVTFDISRSGMRFKVEVERKDPRCGEQSGTRGKRGDEKRAVSVSQKKREEKRLVHNQ